MYEGAPAHREVKDKRGETPRLSPTKISRQRIIETIEADNIKIQKMNRKGGKKVVDLKGAGGDYDEIVEKITSLPKDRSSADNDQIEKS